MIFLILRLSSLALAEEGRGYENKGEHLSRDPILVYFLSNS